jgi:hypothetical protein
VPRAVEQGDEADEAKRIGASQLIPSVRRTWWTGAIVSLAFAASSAAAERPLPIAAELQPTTVSAETPIELVVRSHSSERLDLQVYSKVRVQRHGVQGYHPDVYWAPLSLDGGRFYPSNAMPWLKLDPGGLLTVSFNLARLRWALELPGTIDHGWPLERFSALVPPGEYDVWYEMGGLMYSNGQPVASRPVRLTVH